MSRAANEMCINLFADIALLQSLQSTVTSRTRTTSSRSMKEQLFTSLRRMTTAGGKALWMATLDSFRATTLNRAFKATLSRAGFFFET